MRHEEETHRTAPGNESAGDESGEALLTLHGVHKRYGEVVALHGIDLTLHRGEVVVILGPSGCGKSTLLRTINGLEPIQGGEISMAGVGVFGATCRGIRCARRWAWCSRAMNSLPT